MLLKTTAKTKQHILYILITYCLTRQLAHVVTILFLHRLIIPLLGINYAFISAINHESGFIVRHMIYDLKVILLMRNKKCLLTRAGIFLAASLITLTNL